MRYFDFFEAARYIGQKNLVTASSGNISYRYDTEGGDKILWISASGSWLSDLSQDDLVECSFPDGEVIRIRRDGARPSSELKMHLEILKAREDARAVLHFQSPCATTLAASDRRSWLDGINTIPEIPYYVGDVGWVDYHTPGSELLTDSVREEIKTHDVVFMQNHGQVAVGKSLMDVVQKASFIELACFTLVHGRNTIFLDDQQKQALIDYRNKK